MRKTFILLTTILLFQVNGFCQLKIPASYSNIQQDSIGLYFQQGNNRFYADNSPANFTLLQLMGNATATETGISFDFGLPDFQGKLVYGLIPYGKAPHPLPVFRREVLIKNGKAVIDIIADFSGIYDMIGWQQSGQLSIGYRIITNNGMILFDGEVSTEGKGPFVVVPAIYEGPFVNNIYSKGSIISFETTLPVITNIEVTKKDSGIVKTFASSNEKQTHHEISIDSLSPETEYEYTVKYGNMQQQYSFKTAPAAGSRRPFVFAYSSDSRHALGGGERMIYGANSYIMKKIAAVAHQNKAVFMQFTGDMINGYLSNKEEQLLQLSNWKKSIEPFWHYMPVYVGQGNHEALGYVFENTSGTHTAAFIDKFPYDTESAEALMQAAFVNPDNGPDTEDGNKYDIDKGNIDFPSYKENVFYYTYDNMAMIVLNSDYWYAPTISSNPATSGGLHGYLMDNQIKWLKKIIKQFEADKTIDHIFLTQHTPIFPNGGHVGDDMWYNGNNDKRPYISGKPVKKGIIERRDEYLNLLINKSKKMVAVLTGDEHNYNRLQLTKEVNIYPDNWIGKKLNISRPIYQINNGAAGAPYYAQEKAPWSPYTKAFSVQNAICLFYVNGKSIKMRVVNPDTLNVIDEIQLR
ncbi:MAG: hypothetical protein WBN55_05180 [Eudoraea sp.]|uniref:hypothetical protein n=1 Tax=Eudoraea sp. TaxID=1979955 RepID=UPI003C7952DB